MAEDKKPGESFDSEEDFQLADTSTNPLRVKPPEGQMMAVMKNGGELDVIVASIAGWHFKYQEVSEDPDDWTGEEWEKWELFPDKPNPEDRVYSPPPKGIMEDELGVIFVGFGKALHKPHMVYTKWVLPMGAKEHQLDRKERRSPYFYFQYNMGIPVLEVESVGTFKTTVRINVVVRMTNPYKAIFLAGGWESVFDGAVHGVVRDYISHKTIDKIQREKEDRQKGLIKEIFGLNDDKEGNEGLKKKFGIEVIDARFVSFDVVSPNSKVSEALEAEEVARLELEAVKYRVKGIEQIGAAEAKAAEMLVAAYGSGEAAAIVRAAELQANALIKTQASVVSISTGGGNMPIAVTPSPRAPKEDKKK